MKKELYVIVILSLLSCKTPTHESPDRRLKGTWIVDQVIETDSSLPSYDSLPEYASTEQISGSRFYRAKELKSTIELMENGNLRTKLFFSNFGIPMWTTNEQMDSLTLKLTNVTEESLIAQGTVTNNGELFLYEGAIKFSDADNLEWTLSDGRIFKLKKENAP